MRIGLDLDGVCYEFQRTFMYMARAKFGISRDVLSDISKWNKWSWYEDVMTPEQVEWMWSEGVRQGLFRYGHLYPGAIDGIKRLNNLGDIAVITHRPKEAVLDTMEWLSFNRFPITEVHFLSKGEPKTSVKALCDIYIDDAPHVIDDVINRTLSYAVSVTRPWNPIRATKHSRMFEVSSWDGIVNTAEGLLGKDK